MKIRSAVLFTLCLIGFAPGASAEPNQELTLVGMGMMTWYGVRRP